MSSTKKEEKIKALMFYLQKDFFFDEDSRPNQFTYWQDTYRDVIDYLRQFSGTEKAVESLRKELSRLDIDEVE
jgi:hypothetical protein